MNHCASPSLWEKERERDWMVPQRFISLMLPLMRCIQTQLSYAQQKTRSFSGSVVTSSFFCSSWEKLYCRDQTVTGSALSATTSLLLFCRWFVHRKQMSRCMYINLPVGGTKICIFTHFYVFYVLRKYLIRAQDHFMFLSIFSPKVKSTMMVLKWILQPFVHLLSVNKVIFSLTFNNASVSSNIIFDYCSFLLKQLHNEWIIVRWRNACLLQHVPQLSFTGFKIIVQSTHVSVLRIYFTLSSTIHRASLFISEHQSALWFFYLSLHLEWECRMFLLREQHWMVFIYKVFIQPWPGNLCSLLKFEYSA